MILPTKKIVILTGSELRHNFFRISVASNKNIDVLATFCEGTEKSLENIIKVDLEASKQLEDHVFNRSESEKEYFLSETFKEDWSNPQHIKKGEINDQSIIQKILDLKPDLIACYGSSLIKGTLLEEFQDRFINVHLGLSPYYRGSGTNIWPLINGEPEYVGATFMYIDSGIDTGNIIHQIRADMEVLDSPHDIGNRLINKMVIKYQEIIINFDSLNKMPQPTYFGGKLYKVKDFNNSACRVLYENFNNGVLQNYLNDMPHRLENAKIISNPSIE